MSDHHKIRETADTLARDFGRMVDDLATVEQYVAHLADTHAARRVVGIAKTASGTLQGLARDLRVVVGSLDWLEATTGAASVTITYSTANGAETHTTNRERVLAEIASLT